MHPFVHEIIDSPGLPWRVVCVCDAEGSGRNLAYTVGLAQLGLPELLVWARPTDGDDPGADWRFSHRDLADILDELADLLLGGDIVAGSTLTRDVDAGLSSVVFRVRPETVAAALDVPGLARFEGVGLPDDCYVMPVGWSLVRPPSRAPAADPSPGSGLPVEFDLAGARAAIQEQSTALRAAITARGGRPGRVPPRWRPAPGEVGDAPAGQTGPTGQGAADEAWSGSRFGPLHPLVVARAEQLLLSDAHLLTRFVDAVLDVGDDAPGEVLGPLTSFALATRRQSVPAAAAEAAAEIVRLLVGERGPTLRWRRAWPTSRHRTSRTHEHVLERLARGHLALHVQGLLAAEAFADVLPAALLRQARAAWLAALAETTIT